MPWTADSAGKHKKGLSPESARKWSHIANAVLRKTGNEGRAIRIANSQVKPSSEAIRRRLNIK